MTIADNGGRIGRPVAQLNTIRVRRGGGAAPPGGEVTDPLQGSHRQPPIQRGARP